MGDDFSAAYWYSSREREGAKKKRGELRKGFCISSR
jgi:hypothetical protein